MPPATIKVRPATRSGTRGDAEKTRAAILKAALHEFASEGVAGARTDAIARAAGVNKALLYYYFKDKESLYGAVIDNVFAGLRDRVLEVLSMKGTPTERLLAYAGAHFDYAASAAELPRVLQHAMMRGARSKSPHLKHIAKNYFTPIYEKLLELFDEGVRSGEFRKVDARRVVVCMIGSILHYFHAFPFAVALGHVDPLSPENLAAQRAAVLDFVSHAVLKEKP